MTIRLWLAGAFGLALVLAVGVAFASRGRPADPRITLGRDWPADDRVSIDAIDHRGWDGLLKRYVDPEGRVDYAAWKHAAADVSNLERYLETLSRADPNQSAGRLARLAFWINAYNALTIRGLLREYPTRSIQDHADPASGYNIWRDLRLLVGGRPYSLGQIENEVLRKLDEPRIHFAIVCGSRGCPRLSNEGYTAAGLEGQLTRNARAFFADRTKFERDRAGDRLFVSPILDWYAEDFGKDQAERLRAVAPFLPDEESRRLAGSGKARVSFQEYDWGLNERTSPPRAGGADGR